MNQPKFAEGQIQIDLHLHGSFSSILWQFRNTWLKFFPEFGICDDFSHEAFLQTFWGTVVKP